MNFFGLSTFEMQKFFLIFARMAAIIAVIPFYGERGMPNQLKVGLALLLAIMVMPLVKADAAQLSSLTLFGFGFLLLQSIVAGLLIGFVPVLLFAGIQLGGELSGFQMGFGIVSVMDPLSQNRMSLIAQFDYILAFLIFITLDGHLYILDGVVKSFQVMPLLGANFPAAIGRSLVAFGSQMFLIGIKIAAPIMVALLLTNVGLGILARTMPQMNIFLVGFPLQIGIGLITLGLSIPVFAYVFEKMFYGMFRDWLGVISLF